MPEPISGASIGDAQLEPDPATSTPSSAPPSSDADDARDAAIVILTAGRGTRMRSALPKVLHPLCGIPMVEHVVRAAEDSGAGQLIATLGPTSEALRASLGGRVDLAWQPEPLGTGDATRVALPHLRDDIRWVVVVFGDHPLVQPETLRELIACAKAADALVASVAVVLDDPGPYGRYRRDASGRVVAIVEAHEDDQTYDGPVAVNSGMCCIRRAWLEDAIARVPLAPKGEYYLTALVELAAATPWHTDPVLVVEAPEEVAHGINDRAELAGAEARIRARINRRLMLDGVTLVDPASTWIDVDVTIGADTRIEPGCQLRGATTIGRGCRIGPQTVVEDSRIGDEVVIRGSWIERSEVGDGVDIGPYSHLRPDTRVLPHVHIGNYVETKNATIGSGTAIGHVSYIGDATLGERVNVGAGTITCNFDGRDKHQTTIGDDVFVGSDTMLVAPVTLGDGARTGAGSVVTKPVAPGALVVGVPARPIELRRRRRAVADDTGNEGDTGN